MDPPEYQLDLVTGVLINIKLKRQILAISSPTYKGLIDIFSRFECDTQILVYLEGDELVAKLLRMSLHLQVNGTSIVSREYVGMEMSELLLASRIAFSSPAHTLTGIQ